MLSDFFKVYSFHAINSLVNFNTKFVFQSEKVFFGRQENNGRFVTGPRLRNFDWVRTKLWEDLSSIVHQINVPMPNFYK